MKQTNQQTVNKNKRQTRQNSYKNLQIFDLLKYCCLQNLGLNVFVNKAS